MPVLPPSTERPKVSSSSHACPLVSKVRFVVAELEKPTAVLPM
jgi:hypothetical protein